jgi:hypothetical protein
LLTAFSFLFGVVAVLTLRRTRGGLAAHIAGLVSAWVCGGVAAIFVNGAIATTLEGGYDWAAIGFPVALMLAAVLIMSAATVIRAILLWRKKAS